MSILNSFRSLVGLGKNEENQVRYNHPTLGLMKYDGDGEWHIDNARLPIFEQPTFVSLDGNEEKPTSEALEGYEYILKNWNNIIESAGITESFYSIYEDYFDEPEIMQSDVEAFWKTVLPDGLLITTKDEFILGARFTWQDPNDGHIASATVEGGECIACPYDG